MQAFVPRTRPYLTPVRDEEAESQRKAKSRHARQTRRSTQGVTLTELKEAKRTGEQPPPDGGASPEPGCCATKGSADDRRAQITEDGAEINKEENIMDEQGNVCEQFDASTEFSKAAPAPSPSRGSCGASYCSSSFRVGSRWCKDENQNLIEGAAEQNLSNPQRPKRRYCWESVGGPDYNTAEHERLSRYDSSGESAADKALGRTSSYTRREPRLASVSKEQDSSSTTKDYKKMYAEALNENEKLKSRLQDSKQELARIRSQLEKVTQRHDRLSERSSALVSEKRDKHALEKKVSNMEEDLKVGALKDDLPSSPLVLTRQRRLLEAFIYLLGVTVMPDCVLAELKSDNQRLKDENGALIRVISKLSK